ncbi:uncharacterized protein ACNS7B_012469 isoform 2-T2 [Menidia menidia]
MILVWVTLLPLLCRGHSQVPVVTVQIGEPVTLTCAFPVHRRSSAIYWFKQTAGGDLKTIAMQLDYSSPEYGSGFSNLNLKVATDTKNSTLTFFGTNEKDEGMYHCATFEWREVLWSGTYLMLKGNRQRMSNYTVVQQSAVSDPAGSGDSVTLQCSVLSDSENQTCSEDLSVFWFRAASDESHPHIIYSDGNRANKCNQKADAQRRCVHHFSKSISSSEVGTYYCAVATCGEILFGDGTKVEKGSHFEFKALLVITVCFGISVTINIFLIFHKARRGPNPRFNRREDLSHSQAQRNDLIQADDDFAEGGHALNYAALHFAGGKTTRGNNKKRELGTEESVYSNINI